MSKDLTTIQTEEKIKHFKEGYKKAQQEEHGFLITLCRNLLEDNDHITLARIEERIAQLQKELGGKG